MPLDEQLVVMVEHLFTATPEQLARGEVSLPEPVPAPVNGVVAEDRTIAGKHGPIPVRCYRPEASLRGPLAAFVWNHGGGWTQGDLEMPEADAVSRRISLDLGCVVVSVGYRLAPAHQHPVPLDDVIAAFETVARDSLGLGVDPARVALGGASAGAHLALAAALVLRDAGGPTPAGLFLAYPVTDPIRGHYPEKPPEDCPPVFWIGANMVADLFGTYLGYDPANAGPPAVPAAADVAGLPPTLVTTAYYDSLASQGVAFVEQVRAAGVDVEHHEETSLLHGYLNLVGSLPAADAALARHTTWIQSVLRPR